VTVRERGLKSTSRITSKNIVIPLMILILLSQIFWVACENKTSESTNVTGSSSTIESGYQIKVFDQDKQVASLGLEELHSLPEVIIEMGGDTPETGPTLLSVLELAEIEEYSKIIVSGMTKGRLATAEITLQRSEITPDVILDFNNQGKTKLCGKQIPDSNWIIDVTEIRAE
jgi:hypothetical protein